MKKKRKRKIGILFRKSLCVVTALLLGTNGMFTGGVPVLAQVSTDDAYTIKQGTDGGDRWSELDKSSNGTYTHRYSSYESSKNKALKVDASYGFELVKTKKTKVSVQKGTTCSAPSTYQGYDLKLPDFLQKKYTWFKTENNSAGNIQIKISNLHIYQCNSDGSNGHWEAVDLVRTITGIEKHSGEDGYVALGTGLTNACYVGIEEMKVSSDFYKAGTSTKVTLKSNVTLTDIDTRQYVGISAKQIDGQYVSSNTKLSYKKDGTTNVYYADNDTNYDSEAFTAAGFIFEDTGFDYTFGRIRAEGPTHQEQYIGTGQNMVNFKPASPNKTVSNTEEKVDSTKNTIRDLGQSWYYSVEQPIASNIPENFYYDKFIMKDTIEECMKILDVKIEAQNKDTETIDATDMFNINQSNNVVTATLKNPTTNSAFYKNAVYTLKIKVKMDVPDSATVAQIEALRSKWTQHGHYNSEKKILTEKNKAETLVDEYTLPTNEVSTDIHLSTDGKNEPGLDITKDVNRYEHQVGDKVKYTVKAKNTNDKADTAYFTISDTTLPDSMKLDFTSVKVSGIDAANYTLSQSGNGWLLKSKGDYALPYGSTITITYEATALKASNGTCVDNTASAIAAGIPSKEDKEQVYINSPKVDVEKTAPDRKYKVGDTVGYKVTITNRNFGTFMRNIELSDLVNTEGLEIKEGSVAVLVGGKNVTHSLDITYQDNGKGFDIKTPYNLKNGTIPCIGIAPYSGITNWIDKITVTYDATITDAAAVENDLENVFKAPATENTNGDKIKDDPEIPSGGGESSEDVTMKAPALDITKKSNKQEYKVGEFGKYTLTVKQTKEETTAKNVVIQDAFDQEDGAELNTESIAVHFNDEDITKDCKITTENHNFKIETLKNMTDEDEIEVSYQVYFSKIGTYTNTAVASSDNTKEDRDQNEVEVKAAEPKLTIKKSSDKKIYKVGDIGIYTLEIGQKNQFADAKKIIIEDVFAQSEGFITDAESLTVKFQDTDITKDCKITVENGRFRIETGKDLTYENKITVSYKVTFTKDGTYQNNASVTAENADPKDTENEVDVDKQDVKVIKTVNGKTKTYQVGDLVNYKVTVALTQKNTISKNVEIKDQIPDGLELLEDSIKVEGIKEFTKTSENNILLVKIPSLVYGEKVTVTYQAKVLKSAAGKTLTNKAVVNGEGLNPGESSATVEVPDKPKKTTEEPNKESKDSETPKTGDSKRMAPYAAVVIIAGIGAAVVFIKKRRSK